jgi:hypothetical protein
MQTWLGRILLITVVISLGACGGPSGKDKDKAKAINRAAVGVFELCSVIGRWSIQQPSRGEIAKASVRVVDRVISIREGFPKSPPGHDGYVKCYEATKKAVDSARAAIEPLIKHQEKLQVPPTTPGTDIVTNEPISLEETQQQWQGRMGSHLVQLTWEARDPLLELIRELAGQTAACKKLTDDLVELAIDRAHPSMTCM